MKVGICIIVYNLETRVFILQIEAIKKFCTDDYTIEVVDNSTLKVMREAIEYHAKRLGVKYRNTEPNTNDPSWSHAFAANYSYQKLKDEYDLLAFFDHDLIPVKSFSVKEILGDKIIAGVTQGTKVKYLWPGCLFINNNLVDKDLVRFDPMMEPRLDTGGALHTLVEQYPEGIGWLDEVGCHNPSFSKGFYYFYIMIHQKTFMHFLNSSGWNRKESQNNDERVSSLISIANELINK